VREACAPAAAEHADAVGVVRHQPGVISAGKPRQSGQGREVAVHRKDAVGEDHRPFVARAVFGEQRARMVEVVVPEREQPRSAQLRAGPQAGMRQFVDQHEIVRAEQSWNHSKVGEIAGTENAGALRSLQPGKPCLQLGVERMVASHEPRRPGPDAVTGQRLLRGRDDLGMIDEIEVVVAGEGTQPATVTLDDDAIGPQGAGKLPPQARLREPVKLRLGKFVQRLHPHGPRAT
jgi:hypothetical protein